MELGKLASGQSVVDRYSSHTHQGLTMEVLQEAFAKISLKGEQFQVIQVDFDRIVGKNKCVRTNSDDRIVYALRNKRFGLTRFVKNREPEDCFSVVVILKKAEEDNTYVLVTAFIGEKAQPEPWDRNATEESVEFWNSHALIWGSEETLPGTETTQCPW